MNGRIVSGRPRGMLLDEILEKELTGITQG